MIKAILIHNSWRVYHSIYNLAVGFLVDIYLRRSGSSPCLRVPSGNISSNNIAQEGKEATEAYRKPGTAHGA